MADSKTVKTSCLQPIISGEKKVELFSLLFRGEWISDGKYDSRMIAVVNPSPFKAVKII